MMGYHSLSLSLLTWVLSPFDLFFKFQIPLWIQILAILLIHFGLNWCLICTVFPFRIVRQFWFDDFKEMYTLMIVWDFSFDTFSNFIIFVLPNFCFHATLLVHPDMALFVDFPLIKCLNYMLSIHWLWSLDRWKGCKSWNLYFPPWDLFVCSKLSQGSKFFGLVLIIFYKDPTWSCVSANNRLVLCDAPCVLANIHNDCCWDHGGQEDQDQISLAKNWSCSCREAIESRMQCFRGFIWYSECKALFYSAGFKQAWPIRGWKSFNPWRSRRWIAV